MNALFLNDCSKYHAGSALVSREFNRLCQEVGIHLSKDAKDATLAIVNGEGTLHHSAPRARELLAQMEMLAREMPVVLLNTVWQKMPDKLRHLSLAAARESTSANALWTEAECGRVHTLPDISLCCRHRPAPGKRSGLIFIDSFNKRASAWAAKAAEERGATFVEMCNWKESPESLIDLIARHDGVVTGRFHGLVLALLAGTPVIGLPGNTHKTSAMMRDLGMDGCFCNSWEGLCAALNEGRFGRADPLLPAVAESGWRQLLMELPGLSTKPALPDSPINPEATCVLVGNGPSVTGSGLGRLIDAHDEVVRFNNYAVAGFEKDVGTRTTLWSTFGKGTKPISGEAAKRAIFIHGDSGNPTLPMEATYRIERRFYEAMRKELRQVSCHRNAAKINPTSGFLVTRWLLECGVKRLHLAGFDHFTKHASSKHHYWNDKAFGRPYDHDGDAEARLLQPYVRMGRLRYLSGTAGHGSHDWALSLPASLAGA